jgi:hypothetical protein
MMQHLPPDSPLIALTILSIALFMFQKTPTQMLSKVLKKTETSSGSALKDARDILIGIGISVSR